MSRPRQSMARARIHMDRHPDPRRIATKSYPSPDCCVLICLPATPAVLDAGITFTRPSPRAHGAREAALGGPFARRARAASAMGDTRAWAPAGGNGPRRSPARPRSAALWGSRRRPTDSCAARIDRGGSTASWDSVVWFSSPSHPPYSKAWKEWSALAPACALSNELAGWSRNQGNRALRGDRASEIETALSARSSPMSAGSRASLERHRRAPSKPTGRARSWAALLFFHCATGVPLAQMDARQRRAHVEPNVARHHRREEVPAAPAAPAPRRFDMACMARRIRTRARALSV